MMAAGRSVRTFFVTAAVSTTYKVEVLLVFWPMGLPSMPAQQPVPEPV